MRVLYRVDVSIHLAPIPSVSHANPSAGNYNPSTIHLPATPIHLPASPSICMPPHPSASHQNPFSIYLSATPIHLSATKTHIQSNCQPPQSIYQLHQSICQQFQAICLGESWQTKLKRLSFKETVRFDRSSTELPTLCLSVGSAARKTRKVKSINIR